MYRVLLVDDEPWIMAGLQAMIDWNAEGFEICATASNGIEAEQRAMESRPDFILADIRMPGRDGLTLLRRLRQAGCTALYAIISGYAEFSYAQEGIKLGACGYLLKPVEEEDLLALLRSVRGTLQERYERLLMDELEQETGLIAAMFPGECWIAAVYGDAEPLPLRSLPHCRLSRRSRLYLSGAEPVLTESDVPEGSCVGLSRCRTDLDPSFAAVAAACREASWQGFVEPARRLFRSSDLPRSLSLAATPREMIQLCRERLPRVTIRQLYALYLTIEDCAAGVQADTPEWLLDHFECAAALLDHLEAGLQLREDRDGRDVSIAAYLKEHFQEDLSLDAVSRVLSMSASSARRMLLRETGDTFQHYLVMLRMERACALLKDGALSINEVAYSSGFRDALYFRRAFKKWFGLTPSDYRASNGIL